MNTILNEVIEKIRLYNPEWDVIPQIFTKLNGNTQHGISIREPGENIAPVFYIDAYVEEGMSAEDIFMTIVRMYPDVNKRPCEDLISQINDYDIMQDYLSIILVNRESNCGLMDELVYEEFLEDLLIIPVLKFDTSSETFTMAKVRKSVMDIWKVTEAEIINQAWSNFRREKPIVKSIGDLIGLYPDDSVLTDNEMKVVSTDSHMYGAAMMCNYNLMKKLYFEYGGDFFVIPSSIHEIITMPCYSITLDYINEMVREVNENCVKFDEILSNHAYIFGDFGGVIGFKEG